MLLGDAFMSASFTDKVSRFDSLHSTILIKKNVYEADCGFISSNSGR